MFCALGRNNIAQRLIHKGDVFRTGFNVGKPWVIGMIVVTGCFEKQLPMPVGVGHDTDQAIGTLIGLSPFGECAGVTRWLFAVCQVVAIEMLNQKVGGHGLEHWYFDELTHTGPLALK